MPIIPSFLTSVGQDKYSFVAAVRSVSPPTFHILSPGQTEFTGSTFYITSTGIYSSDPMIIYFLNQYFNNPFSVKFIYKTKSTTISGIVGSIDSTPAVLNSNVLSSITNIYSEYSSTLLGNSSYAVAVDSAGNRYVTDIF